MALILNPFDVDLDLGDKDDRKLFAEASKGLSKKSLLMAIHVRLRDDVNIDLKATVFIKSFKGGWLISTQKTSHKLAFTWLSLGTDGVGSYSRRSKKVS